MASKRKLARKPSLEKERKEEIDEIQTSDFVIVEEEKKIRAQVTLDTVLEELEEIESLLSTEINILRGLQSRTRRVRKLQTIRRKIESVKKKVPKLSKKKRPIGKNKNYGFGKLKTPSKALVNFLGLEKDVQISRTDATRAICCYIHFNPDEKREETIRWKESMNHDGKRNLQDPSDKNRILPDAALAKFLDHSKYKKDVKDGKIIVKRKQPNGKYENVVLENDGLYYTTIQRLLTRHLS